VNGFAIMVPVPYTIKETLAQEALVCCISFKSMKVKSNVYYVMQGKKVVLVLN
jgi:hypothetical protein